MPETPLIRSFGSAVGLVQDENGKIELVEKGGRQWLRSSEQTLFGRSVDWIIRAFGGKTKADKALEMFSNELDKAYKNYGLGPALKRLTTRKWREGTSLPKIYNHTKETAEKLEEALPKYLPELKGSEFDRVAARMIATELSAKQRKLAAAVIQFEVVARIEAGEKVEGEDLEKIVGAAALLASELRDDQVPDTLQFTGDKSIQDTLEDMKKEKPYELTALGMAFNDAYDLETGDEYSPISFVKEAVNKVAAPLLARFSRLSDYFPDDLFLGGPDHKDFDSVHKLKIRLDPPKHEVDRCLSDPKGENGLWSTAFWRWADCRLPININTVVKKEDEKNTRKAVNKALNALARQSPAVKRVLHYPVDLESLENFKNTAAQLRPGDKEVAVTLQGKPSDYRQFFDVSIPSDGKLTLVAQCLDNGDIKISAEMEAQLADSSSARDAMTELKGFVKGNEVVAHNLTRVLNKNIANYPAIKVLEAFKPAGGSGLRLIDDPDRSHHTIRLSRTNDDDIVVDVTEKIVATAAANNKSTIPLDPDESGIELQWKFAVSGASLKNSDSNPQVTSEPIEATLYVKFPLPESRPDVKFDPNDPPEAQEVASSNAAEGQRKKDADDVGNDVSNDTVGQRIAAARFADELKKKTMVEASGELNEKNVMGSPKA